MGRKMVAVIHDVDGGELLSTVRRCDARLHVAHPKTSNEACDAMAYLLNDCRQENSWVGGWKTKQLRSH